MISTFLNEVFWRTLHPVAKATKSIHGTAIFNTMYHFLPRTPLNPYKLCLMWKHRPFGSVKESVLIPLGSNLKSNLLAETEIPGYTSDIVVQVICCYLCCLLDGLVKFTHLIRLLTNHLSQVKKRPSTKCMFICMRMAAFFFTFSSFLSIQVDFGPFQCHRAFFLSILGLREFSPLQCKKFND